MVDFGVMNVEGFASIANESFDWGIPGLNVIQAPNGFGKTKFINALVWGLFGKTLSGSVTPWKHSRAKDYKGTKVEILFRANGELYSVTRYKDYTKFKNSLIIKHGNKVLDVGDKYETQAYLEYLIGYTYELFKNSIVFGQKLKRLIAETGPNKKKVLDDAFQIMYIPKAKAIAEGRLKDYKTEYQSVLSSWELLKYKLQSKNDELERERQVVNTFEDNKFMDIQKETNTLMGYKATLQDIKNNHPTINQDIHNLESELEILEKGGFTRLEMVQMEKDLTKLESKRDYEIEKAESKNTEITKINKQLKDIPKSCSQCGRAFTSKDLKSEESRLTRLLKLTKKEYQLLIDSIGSIKGQIKEKQGEISSATKVQESITINKEKLERLENSKKKILELKVEIRKHKDNIISIKEKELKNRIPEIEIELTALERQFKIQNKNVKKINRDIRTYEWLVKDPLSNAGLKAFIFNHMLDDINERLDYYTKFVGLQIGFVMDMKSAHKNLETFVFKDDNPVPYDDLSGGQQQAVDIVTAFAIHDITSDISGCSLFVMDELFESLDKDNIEIMTDIIQDKSVGKCLYLVTHRSEFSPTNSNIILIDYVNGFTSLA